MVPSVLVLGGGFGGAAVATRLKEKLGDGVHVTLIDRSEDFQVGATKTWVMLGQVTRQSVTAPLKGLASKGIHFVHAEVLSISPEERKVETDKGAFSADFLVIALGVEMNSFAIPGLAEHAETFYKPDGAEHLSERLKAYTKGQLLMLIARGPFQCPPAPYEAAMLLAEYFEKKGVRDQVQIDVWTIEPSPMATAGVEIGRMVVEMLTERGIGFVPRKKAVSVEAGKVLFEDGSDVSFDLLVAIPPHAAPKCVRASGLVGPNGWINVDPKTLRVEDYERVFAIGDVNSVMLPGRFSPDSALFLPKAGVFAEAEGFVVADNIASELTRQPQTAALEGKGSCYIEIGGGQAMRGVGAFFALPFPAMSPEAPSQSALEEKKRWASAITDRLGS